MAFVFRTLKEQEPIPKYEKDAHLQVQSVEREAEASVSYETLTGHTCDLATERPSQLTEQKGHQPLFLETMHRCC